MRLDVSSMLYAGVIVHDVVHSSQSPCRILDDFCLIGSIRQEEYCLSVAQILTSKYLSRVDDRMKIERTSNMVNMLEEVARNNNIVL